MIARAKGVEKMAQLLQLRAMLPIQNLDDFQACIQAVEELTAIKNRTPLEQAVLDFQAKMLDIYES